MRISTLCSARDTSFAVKVDSYFPHSCVLLIQTVVSLTDTSFIWKLCVYPLSALVETPHLQLKLALFPHTCVLFTPKLLGDNLFQKEYIWSLIELLLSYRHPVSWTWWSAYYMVTTSLIDTPFRWWRITTTYAHHFLGYRFSVESILSTSWGCMWKTFAHL
jgi:hypothetical protein